MHCQQSRRKRLVVHTGKMVTRLFAERNFCRKSFFVALRIRERSDMASKKDGLSNFMESIGREREKPAHTIFKEEFLWTFYGVDYYRSPGSRSSCMW